MSTLKRRAAPFMATIILLLGPGNSQRARSDAPGAIRMFAWPSYVSVPSHGHVPIQIAVENTTQNDKFLRPCAYPLPGDGGLEIRCRNLASGADVPFISFPIPFAVETESGVVHTHRIPPGDFCGQSVDLTRFYDFKPGVYSVVLWADTTVLPWWANRTLPTEWKGITNRVTIIVHVAK